MFSPNQQMPVHGNLLSVQVPSPINHPGQNGSPFASVDGAANTPFSQAKAFIDVSQKLEDELILIGKGVKHHEDNIKLLKKEKTSLDDKITDIQVIIGKNDSSSEPMVEDDKPSEQTSSTNNVLGAVATLGKVNDENLSRLLSQYLGLDTMITLVCKTFDGIEALEISNKEGFFSKISGFNELGSSTRRIMDGSFNVICLQNIRPYVGEFMPDDHQRRLDLLKPKLPNGETPPGFLGFAVNMIHIDNPYLGSLTTGGHGLRETLFHKLFSRLQVYKTRVHMLQALPLLADGAISLDGGIIKSNGVLVFGDRKEVDVKFAISSYQPENLAELQKKMEELKRKKETTMEEIQREESILTHVKYTFQVKKQEFVKFMAQSSPYAMQFAVPATPRRPTPR